MLENSKSVRLDPFLRTSQRILVIVQLCFAFSLILWNAAQPFTGEYFSIKSRLLPYEYVMGISNLLQDPEGQKKLPENAKRFASLSEQEKKSIENDYRALIHYSARPISSKLFEGFKAFLFTTPPFELAWILFAPILCIFLLLKKEGSKQAIWLLPAIALFFGIDNRLNGQKSGPPGDAFLFPSEETIIREYLGEPFSSGVGEQHRQLQYGWENYLIKNWSESPPDKEISRKDRLAEAEFRFTLERIHSLRRSAFRNGESGSPKQISVFFLTAYLAWNLFFAFRISEARTKLRSQRIKEKTC